MQATAVHVPVGAGPTPAAGSYTRSPRAEHALYIHVCVLVYFVAVCRQQHAPGLPGLASGRGVGSVVRDARLARR